MKRFNLYKPGSAEYYEDQLTNIVAVANCYDGYNSESAIQMKELVDALANMANDALNHKKLYVRNK